MSTLQPRRQTQPVPGIIATLPFSPEAIPPNRPAPEMPVKARPDEAAEHKQRDRQIREQARLLDAAQDAIIVQSLAGEIEFWNRGAERLFGWAAGEALGCTETELLRADAAAAEEARRAVLDAGEWSGELRLEAKDGRPVIVSARWSLLRDEQGVPKSILAIKTDLTERKQLEERYLRAQRMESIGILASGVAHDLNNILSPILMSASLLRTPLPPDVFASLVSTIETSAQRGADIVKQVLTFARGVEGERVPLRAKHLCREIERIAVETFPKNIAIRRCIEPDVALIEGDATQLHQVLMNLCVNARDAMPAGGVLTISARNFEVDAHYAAMVPGAVPGRHVLLSVHDTGEGIPRDVIEKIFDPFFTTKAPGKGTGLGLSITLGIVKSHGGFLAVDSEPGRGTTFQIFLPAAAGAPSCGAEPDEAAAPRGHGEKILIVDDESGLREVTEMTLRMHGYATEVASDGAEAVALYAQQKGGFSAVVTDIMMPIMDGVAMCRALRRIDPAARIIAATGSAGEGRAEELEAIGVEKVLIKPFCTAKLLRALDDSLRALN